MPDPVIEPVKPEEQAEVIALWEACALTRPWNDPQADFCKALDGPSSTILVARNDMSDLTGSIMIGHDGHRGWVYYLAVAPENRGNGIGSALMRAAESWLRDAGMPKVQLMVRDGIPAADFYVKLGYEVQQVSTLGRWLKD
jgi:ribosomal protein S18 acetylase RimI-like enzyme